MGGGGVVSRHAVLCSPKAKASSLIVGCIRLRSEDTWTAASMAHRWVVAHTAPRSTPAWSGVRTRARTREPETGSKGFGRGSSLANPAEHTNSVLGIIPVTHVDVLSNLRRKAGRALGCRLHVLREPPRVDAHLWSPRSCRSSRQSAGKAGAGADLAGRGSRDSPQDRCQPPGPRRSEVGPQRPRTLYTYKTVDDKL